LPIPSPAYKIVKLSAGEERMHVTFIHGISNKPAKDALHTIWKRALENAAYPLNLGANGITSQMVYWADVFYEAPVAEGAYESSEEPILVEIGPSTSITRTRPTSDAQNETAWLSAVSQRLGIDESVSRAENSIRPTSEGSMANELERIPLPGIVKDAFLREFLRDVHHYLFNATFSPRTGVTYQVQTEIQRRFVGAVKLGAAKPGPHVIVSHSMGTVIAYDCLKRVPDCPKVDAFVTIGSPLGIDEVQDKLQPGWTRDDGFPSQKVAGHWLNFFDRLDVVCALDPYLANDFRQNTKMKIDDVSQSNEGLWRHDISKYLSGKEVSAGISRLFGL
jgi:hypothetical protein